MPGYGYDEVSFQHDEVTFKNETHTKSYSLAELQPPPRGLPEDEEKEWRLKLIAKKQCLPEMR